MFKVRFFLFEGGLEIYINGSRYDGYSELTNRSKRIEVNLKVSKRSENCFTVVFKSGSGVEFCEEKQIMTFVVTLSDDYFNQTKGLLGTYNEDPDDDFTLPNGTVLYQNLDSRDIHYLFGLQCKSNWRGETMCSCI